MERSLTTLAAALLILGLSTTAGCAASYASRPVKVAPQVRMLSVTAPRVITNTSQRITVHVRVSGMTLDRIPAAAYKTPNLRHVVAVAAGPIFTFTLSRQWRKAAHGKHHYLIALAQNNELLYRAKAARFSLTVK